LHYPRFGESVFDLGRSRAAAKIVCRSGAKYAGVAAPGAGPEPIDFCENLPDGV
jgi:hypothetical protein